MTIDPRCEPWWEQGFPVDDSFEPFEIPRHFETLLSSEPDLPRQETLKTLIALTSLRVPLESMFSPVCLTPGFTNGSNADWTKSTLTPAVAAAQPMFAVATRPELVARIGEAIWTCKSYLPTKPDFGAVKARTIEAYLQLGTQYATDDSWVPEAIALARAFVLASCTQKKGGPLGAAMIEVLKVITEHIDRAVTLSNKRFLALHLLRGLLNSKVGTPSAAPYAGKVFSIAKSCEGPGQYSGHNASSWYELAVKLAAAGGAEAAAKAYQPEVWEAHFRVARANRGKDAMRALMAAREGFDLAKLLGADAATLAPLKLEVEAVEREVLTTLHETSFEVDVTREVLDAQRRGASMSFSQFTDSLCQCLIELGRRDSQSVVIAQDSQKAFLKFTHVEYLDERGARPARKPLHDERGALDNDEMQRRCRDILVQNFCLLSNIEFTPAACAWKANTPNWESMVTDLVNASVFVPNSRKTLVTRGLIAGFNGDHTTAVHLLAPQIENGLRTLIRLEGHSTQKHRGDRYLEMNARQALEYAGANGIIPPVLVRLIDDSFVSSDGTNARNSHCHGLWDDEHYARPEAALVCWIALFLIRLTAGSWSGAMAVPRELPPHSCPGCAA